MPIPNGILKLTFSGLLAGGAEQWAFSLYLKGYTDIGGSGENSYDGSTEWDTATYNAWRAAFLSCMRPADSLQQLDSYYYEGGVATQHAVAPAVHPGTGSAATHPTQIAIVMTLRTALATRSGRGRIYIPGTAMVMGAVGLYDPTQGNTCVDNLALWMGDTASVGHPFVVVSQTHNSSAEITSVDCDQVPDTQRRRRNQLVSARHSHAVA